MADESPEQDLMLAILAFIAFAAASDYLALLWHRAREQRQLVNLLAISVLMESLGWAALWFALVREDRTVALASIAGCAIGTTLGYCRITADDSDPIVQSAICPEASCCPPSLEDGASGEGPSPILGGIPWSPLWVQQPESVSAPSANANPMLPRVDAEQQRSSEGPALEPVERITASIGFEDLD
jgi:hypothetical protein